MGDDHDPPDNVHELPGAGDHRLAAKRAAAAASGHPSKGEQVRAGMTAAAQKRRQVLQMRQGGATVEQIAKALGTTEPSVGSILKRIFDKWEAQIESGVDDALKLELGRIDTLLQMVWVKAVNAPVRPKPEAEPREPYTWKTQKEAIETVLKLQAQRARYLGLNAPEKHEHTGVVMHEVVDPKEFAAAEEAARAQLPPADITLAPEDVLELPGG